MVFKRLKKVYRRSRNRHGSMITFATVLALALVVIGLGFLAFLMYMGGQSETKNAVDAGALNVGRQSLDNISVNLGMSANQRVFNDVASDDETGSGVVGDNRVTLRRINRIWAKAMLIAINAEAAGGQAGSGNANAQSALNGATTISNSLSDRLNNASNHFGFFNAFASRNSVRMLGPAANVRVHPGSGWQTSLMERQKESNITLAGTPGNNHRLPPGFNLNGNYTTQTTRSSQTAAAGGKWFFKGYLPLRVGGKTFWQVPFLYEEKPHLVSSTLFDRDKPATTALSWNKPVPNAFSVHGVGQQRGSVGEQARSWVITNPRQTYKMSMPHSFLHIKVDDNKSRFYFYPTGIVPPVPFGQERTYGYTPTTQTQAMPFGGLLCSAVTGSNVLVGLDVVGRTLDGIIFGSPRGNTRNLENQMTARINQMISKVGVTLTANDLHSCLSNPATIGYLVAGQRNFYIYSANGRTITCKPRALAIAEAPWLATMINKSADGTERTIVSEATRRFGSVHMPTVTPLPFHVVLIQLGWSNWKKQVWWEPGTGYNGSLGTVRVKRWTEIHSRGVCTPVI